MADFVWLGWDLAFKYRTPAMILSDGVIGQMMEKVVLPDQRPRRTEEEIRQQCPWALNGRKGLRKQNIVRSLELDSAKMELNNIRFQETYRTIEANEVRIEMIDTDDCDFLLAAFGSMARVCEKVKELATDDGYKVGLARPITLWPFPYEQIGAVAKHCKGIMVAELNAGQMIEDVRLAAKSTECPIVHYGRMGGIVPNPEEVYEALKAQINK